MLHVHVPKFEPLRKKLIAHPTRGKGQIISPEGDVMWEDADWMENALLDEGEFSILNVYYLLASNPQKYLCLIAGSSTAPVETDTMAYLGGGANAQEVKVPGVDGYPTPRVEIIAGDWGAVALNSGDGQTTAAEKTIGPAATNPWNSITHVGLVTGATGQIAGSGKFLNSIALSATQSVSVGFSFKYTLSVKAQ